MVSFSKVESVFLFSAFKKKSSGNSFREPCLHFLFFKAQTKLKVSSYNVSKGLTGASSVSFYYYYHHYNFILFG